MFNNEIMFIEFKNVRRTKKYFHLFVHYFEKVFIKLQKIIEWKCCSSFFRKNVLEYKLYSSSSKNIHWTQNWFIQYQKLFFNIKNEHKTFFIKTKKSSSLLNCEHFLNSRTFFNNSQFLFPNFRPCCNPELF